MFLSGRNWNCSCLAAFSIDSCNALHQFISFPSHSIIHTIHSIFDWFIPTAYLSLFFIHSHLFISLISILNLFRYKRYHLVADIITVIITFICLLTCCLLPFNLMPSIKFINWNQCLDSNWMNLLNNRHWLNWMEQASKSKVT